MSFASVLLTDRSGPCGRARDSSGEFGIVVGLGINNQVEGETEHGYENDFVNNVIDRDRTASLVGGQRVVPFSVMRGEFVSLRGLT